MVRGRVLAAAVALTLSASGCGADSSTANDSSSAPSTTASSAPPVAHNAPSSTSTPPRAADPVRPVETAPAISVPGSISAAPPCDDEGACAEGFLLDDAFIMLDCTPIKESAITTEVIATGRVRGEEVTVNAIEGVDPAVMMAISLPGGSCSDGEDPDERFSAWSLAIPSVTFPDRVDHGRLREAVCRVGDLSARQREANECDDAGAGDQADS